MPGTHSVRTYLRMQEGAEKCLPFPPSCPVGISHLHYWLLYQAQVFPLVYLESSSSRRLNAASFLWASVFTSRSFQSDFRSVHLAYRTRQGIYTASTHIVPGYCSVNLATLRVWDESQVCPLSRSFCLLHSQALLNNRPVPVSRDSLLDGDLVLLVFKIKESQLRVAFSEAIFRSSSSQAFGF